MPATAPLLEVSASSAPKEVIGAIVSSAGAQAKQMNPNRWLQLTLAGLIIFSSIVYFREEIYTITKDVHKYPILSVVENLQVRQYLGSNWVFGSGKDAKVTVERLEADVVMTGGVGKGVQKVNMTEMGMLATKVKAAEAKLPPGGKPAPAPVSTGNQPGVGAGPAGAPGATGPAVAGPNPGAAATLPAAGAAAAKPYQRGANPRGTGMGLPRQQGKPMTGAGAGAGVGGGAGTGPGSVPAAAAGKAA